MRIKYNCDSLRIDAFELWCWRRLLRVPWTARRSNQSILKEISPGISLEGMMLKRKLQYFGHLMRRVDSLEKTLMPGGIGGRRRRGRPRMRWLDGITDSMDVSEWTPGVGDGQGGLACCDSWGHKESDTTEWLSWTELNWVTVLNWTEWKKPNINKWRDIPCSSVGRINIVKMTILPNVIYTLSAIPIKVQMAFFTELEQKYSQFIWKHRIPSNSQSNLEKEEWSWWNQPFWL